MVLHDWVRDFLVSGLRRPAKKPWWSRLFRTKPAEPPKHPVCQPVDLVFLKRGAHIHPGMTAIDWDQVASRVAMNRIEVEDTTIVIAPDSGIPRPYVIRGYFSGVALVSDGRLLASESMVTTESQYTEHYVHLPIRIEC
jgi:hypothetical protein